MARLILSDQRFFDAFAELAAQLTAVTKSLRSLLDEPARLDELVHEIKAREHAADSITRDVLVRLNTTFVTQLDRDDIYRLTTHLDGVIDLVDGTARQLAMFHIAVRDAPALELAEILLRASEALEVAIQGLRHPRTVFPSLRTIKSLEEDGDAAYMRAVGELFTGRLAPLEVIKWKALYDHLENAIDECQHATEVLESIVVKYA